MNEKTLLSAQDARKNTLEYPEKQLAEFNNKHELYLGMLLELIKTKSEEGHTSIVWENKKFPEKTRQQMIQLGYQIVDSDPAITASVQIYW